MEDNAGHCTLLSVYWPILAEVQVRGTGKPDDLDDKRGI